MTYGEYLKSLGATDDEVKVMDTPIARRAYDAQVKAEADAIAARDAAVADKQRHHQELEKWQQETVIPSYKKMEQDMIASKAEAARVQARLRAAEEAGLLERTEPARPTDRNANESTVPGFDPQKYITRDELTSLSDNVGAGLAALEDMVAEHAQLFPDKRLRVRDLRAEAVRAGKDVYSYWESKYDVAKAREARDAADKSAYEKKLRDEGAAAAREEFQKSQIPGAGPFVSSQHSWIRPRQESGRDAQPWTRNEAQMTNERVAKATQSVLAAASKPN